MRAIGYPLVLAVVGAVLWRVTIWMPGAAPSGPLPPLTVLESASAARLRADVDTLAGRYARRAYGTDVLDSSGAFVARRFAEVGYTVTEQSYTAAGHTVKNLEVTIKGSVLPDSIVLVGAHYDVVVGTPGADDNASGTAALLELARLLAGAAPARTIRLVAFTLEEPPFFWSDSMGSVVYAKAARARGDAITAMLSLEALGNSPTRRDRSAIRPCSAGSIPPSATSSRWSATSGRARSSTRWCATCGRTSPCRPPVRRR